MSFKEKYKGGVRFRVVSVMESRKLSVYLKQGVHLREVFGSERCSRLRGGHLG